MAVGACNGTEEDCFAPGSNGAKRPLSRHFTYENLEIKEVKEIPTACKASVRTSKGNLHDSPAVKCEGPALNRDISSPGELITALAKRRSSLEANAQIWESSPETSTADAPQARDMIVAMPPLHEWLDRFQTPEEDQTAELLAQGLDERGDHPHHAPQAPTQVELMKLQELARNLELMQCELEKERSRLGSTSESLKQREAEIVTKETQLQAQQKEQQSKTETLKDYPLPPWYGTNLKGTMNIGVVGNSGVGKSLLINRLRNVQPGAAEWAPVGVKETTMLISMYAFPNEPRVQLWDFPGAGTPAFPLETYIARMGLRYLDKVIIVTAGRFTETDLKLRSALDQFGVPYVLVRTKVDIDVWNNKEDNGANEQQTLAQITQDLHITCGVQRPFLVSLRDTNAHDFNQLRLEVFPCLATPVIICPFGPGWEDSWALPQVYSQMVSALQGRWSDPQGNLFYVHGMEVYIKIHTDAEAFGANLSETPENVVWLLHWWINAESVRRGRPCGEVRWSPVNLKPGVKPLVWKWLD